MQNDVADHGSAALSDDEDRGEEDAIEEEDEMEDEADDEVSYANTIHHREQLVQQAHDASDDAR